MEDYERPTIRALVGVVVRFDITSGDPMLAIVDVSEAAGEMLRTAGFWRLSDPDDEVTRDLYDMRKADEQRWSRLFNRK